MAERWRDERERSQGPRDRDDLRYAGETILGRADWGDRESDYEHGFRPMRVRDDWHAAERRAQWPRESDAARSTMRNEHASGRAASGRDEADYRYAGETALGRADWGDRESDYEHGFQAFREGRWPNDRGHIGKGPRGYQRSDERIFEEVCDRLTDDPRVDATDVEVRVENGEVTLAGTVRSRQEKHRAEDLVERLSGVRDVHNHLRVSHGTIGESGAPKTPLNLASPGGEARAVGQTSERKGSAGTSGPADRTTARAMAREQSRETRGRRPR
jgi:hypothetical protein